MNYRGHVRNGVVVFDEQVPLSDGTAVEIEVAPSDGVKSSLRDLLLEFAGKAKGLPPDMARNHDHYLYGAPKK